MRRRNVNLGFRHTTTLDMGQLVPLAMLEVLPGDTFRARTSLYARIAPMVNPLMHNVEIRVSSWYVPNRILWHRWEDWITGSEGDEAQPHPVLTPANQEQTKLFDYMGAEPIVGASYSIYPIRAYNLIWNEYFRDIDIQSERAVDEMTLARVNWERDYFTSCRPAPQQGDAGEIPVSLGAIPITSIRKEQLDTLDGWFPAQNNEPTEKPDNTWKWDGIATLAGDGSLGIDINEFRRAMAYQRFAEARMRYGDRYVDYLKYLGVNPSDGRLQRPEYLGGSNQLISFSEVLATAEGDNTNVGDMAGHGIAGLSARPWRKMFEEHGIVLILMQVRPRTQYSNGIPRSFTRIDPMDHWQRELEILPWQEVKETEIFGAGDASKTFGYQPRYNEYRHMQSYASMKMRQGQPMEDWHMARSFASAPTLNGSFLTCTPTDRIYADTSIPEVVVSSIHDISARRLVGSKDQIGRL